MQIEWLQVRNVRNLSNLRIDPGPQLNIITGPNGSGKTALLEAIHFLGRCRSFRTSGVNRIIRYRQKELVVSAGLRLPDRSQVITGVQRTRTTISIRYDNRTVPRVSEQAAQIPVITITPDSHRLVSGSPVYRRRWLDWAMFHVKPDYIDTWRDYHKALKNRNSLLRKNSVEQLGTWERAMAQAAEKINSLRDAFISELAEELVHSAGQLEIPLAAPEYERGWQPGVGLEQYLAQQRKGDLERGMTRHGIHRSDIAIREEGRDIGLIYSRGQVKLYIIALALAQDSVFRRRTGRNPVILVDDLPAELDDASQRRVIEALAQRGGQVFITATGGIPTGAREQQAMFHVEQGRIL